MYDISLIFVFLGYGLANSLTIDFSGNTFFSSTYLIAGFNTVHDKGDVEALIESILTKYSDAGFPFCRVAPGLVYLHDTIEKVILNIDEGERIIISDYVFNVEGSTEVAAVRKITGLKSGYFSPKEIARSKNILMKTGAFETIEEHIIHRDDNYFVWFNMTEKNSDFVTALGSFAEDNIHFGITFSSINLLGTLRQLQFRYEYKKLFSVKFTEPVLIAPSRFDLDFSLWTYDSVRLAQLGAAFTAPLGQYFNISLITGFEAVSHFDNGADTQDGIDNLVGLGIGVDYKRFGWMCQHDIIFEYLFRQFDRRSVKYDGMMNIGDIYIKPHYYWVKTDSFDYFDYFRIGGARDIRGYLEEEFTASKALWLNLEYRKFFLFPIFDIGMINDDLKFSYGFGIAAESDIANASLTFAWPRQSTWQDGKVHILFEKGF